MHALSSDIMIDMPDNHPPPPDQPARKTLLVFSQVFVPNPASVGQHMADVATEMARRGHRVCVYTANRGYDDPSVRYPARETLHGVEIHRLSFSSFGKKSIPIRLLGIVIFMTKAFLIALFKPGVDGIFFSTSPPMIGLVLTVARMIRRLPGAYWAMDLNPDQLIALGKIRADGLTARVLEWGNRLILRRTNLVVALDRLMAGRLESRVNLGDRLVVIPPWPHEQCLEDVPPEKNPFRQAHGLGGKFVIMYSGNHSPSNPLDTLLEAVKRLREDPKLVFMFVGGGIGKKKVEQFVRENGLSNALCLPYQPLEGLRYSISAADVHVVSLGAGMAGIVHPCKIYGAMAVARPVLFLGPSPSHVAELLDKHGFGFRVAHGDVDDMVAAIQRLCQTDRQTLQQMGRTAQCVLQSDLSQALLCGRFCDRLEGMMLRP
jgi:colanic acid biosynthesis glycosyl transferase WcaI